MLHLHRRNGIWHVRRVDGNISRTLQTRNKVLAQCRTDKLEKELRLGHTQVTWEEFVEAFKTLVATRDVADNTRKKYLFVVDRFTAYVQFQGYGKVRRRRMTLLTPTSSSGPRTCTPPEVPPGRGGPQE